MATDDTAPTGTTPAKKAAKTARKAPAKKATATKTPARKATSKTASKTASKAPARKTTARKRPTEVKARRADAGALQRLTDSAQAFAGQAGRTASSLSQDVAETAGQLGRTAARKAQRSFDRSREFIRNHPKEAAGLAAAGLTVAAAVLTRRGLGGAAKTVVATGLAAKAASLGTQAAGKAGTVLKDLRQALQSKR